MKKLYFLSSALFLVACGDDSKQHGIDAPTHTPDAPVDAALDAIPIDAPPLALTTVDVGTSSGHLDEGTGAANGRPAIVTIEGVSLATAATVTAAFVETSVAQPTVASFQTSSDRIAIGVRLPVLTDLAEGETRTLRVTVTGGGYSDSKDVVVDGHNELTLTAAANATVDATPDLYSQITITGAVHYATNQASPVILRATGGATISSPLDVNANGTAPGPHGCAGGAASAAGSCASLGGGAGANANVVGNGGGGGGGGFAAIGGAGVGGAVGGAASGNDMLVPIITPAGQVGNRGNGGGGGGTGMLVMGTAAGSVGGGGGGVVMLDVGGDITINGTGALAATGANGGGMGGAGGGGGGGAGGAIFVRTGASITAPASSLRAAGGAAGQANWAGGTGSVGRIRIDAAAGTLAEITALAATPAPARGPSWDAATAMFTTQGSVTFTLHGAASRAIGITLNDVADADAMTDANGTAQVQLTLVAGRNHVCALWAAAASATNLDRAEAKSCIDVVYVD